MIAEDTHASPSVHIDHLRKSFGGFSAVKDFTLDIEAGEFVTFLGPSGCGKSTTLKMLSGLLVQDEGEIRFGGRRIDMLPANKRNIGLVFQNYALFPHMTVADNIAFGLRMRGWSKARKAERVEQLLALVRLEGLAARKPEQLSGGQQQRVAVARALAFRPDLVLLDEPLSNLDAKLREQVRLDLRQIQREARQTTVFVTHDQIEALVMSDRIVLMNAGQIEQVGTPTELYETPTTEFGARFVGTNNLLPGTLSGSAAQRLVALDGAGRSVALTSLSPGLADNGQPVWLCIRPEDIALKESSKPRAVAANDLPAGQVADRIYQGTSILIDVDVDGLGRMRAEGAASELGNLAIGMRVSVQYERSHAVAR